MSSSVCTSIPPDTFFTVTWPDSGLDNSMRRIFFFASKISRASFVKAGAMITSKKILLISSAVATSTSRFNATMPPKADTESASYALTYASCNVDAVAAPHGLVCLIIHAAGSVNSHTIFHAASISTILL